MQWYLKVLKNYINFSGRAHRTEYWMFMLVNMLISIALGFIVALLSGGNPNSSLDLINSLYSLALLLPTLAVTVRRLHDTDRSGLWLLPQFLIIPIAIFMAFSMAASANPNIESLMGKFVAILGLFMIYGIVMFIFMVLPGTDGPNRFGDDPWDSSYENEYDDEYYEDEYEYDDEYDDAPPPRRYARDQSHNHDTSGEPVRRYPQREQEQGSRSAQNDIYDLNASFNEMPDDEQPQGRKERRDGSVDQLSNYRNPFDSSPSDEEKKQFNRFGLVDDDFGLEEDSSQNSSNRRPSSDSDYKNRR